MIRHGHNGRFSAMFSAHDFCTDVQLLEEVSLHPSIFWRHLLQKWPDNLRGWKHVVQKESVGGEACLRTGDSGHETMFEGIMASLAPPQLCFNAKVWGSLQDRGV